MEAIRVRRFARRSGITIVLSIAFLIGLLASVATANHPGQQWDADVAPQFVSGNPTCSQMVTGIEGLRELKIQPVVSGTYFLNGFSVTIDIHNVGSALPLAEGGQAFDFTTSGGTVFAVVVKGGPNANLYDYRPNGTTSDEDLHAPVNHSNNKYYGLSHISFCFTPPPPAGALKIVKNSTKGGAVTNAGAVFSYNGTSVTDNGAGDLNSAIGVVCVQDLNPGSYTVTETSPPPGYGAGTPASVNVTVASGTNCTSNQPTGTGNGLATFTNPPLADLLVRVEDAGSGETFSSIDCGSAGTAGIPTPQSTVQVDTDDLPPGTYTCTIVIDP